MKEGDGASTQRRIGTRMTIGLSGGGGWGGALGSSRVPPSGLWLSVDRGKWDSRNPMGNSFA
jgi:hypothetical protein